MKKGRKGFDELVISIIQERTQIFLAESLNKAFEEKRKRFLGNRHIYFLTLILLEPKVISLCTPTKRPSRAHI